MTSEIAKRSRRTRQKRWYDHRVRDGGVCPCGVTIAATSTQCKRCEAGSRPRTDDGRFKEAA